MPEILFSDNSIVVCIKPAKISSQEDGTENSMPALLRAAENCDFIAAVHRLDKDVSGVMVYAKTRQAAAELSRQASEGEMKKEYLAVIRGVPEAGSGVYEDLLFHDSSKNKSYTVKRMRRGVRKASLEYEVLNKNEAASLSLVKILLHTGRTHQIRVQFSSRGTPLMGDRKYGGGGECGIALFARSLGFNHPVTGEEMVFSAKTPNTYPWDLF